MVDDPRPTDRFGALVIVLLMTVGLLIAIDDSSALGKFLAPTFTVLIVAAAMRAGRAERRWRRLTELGAVIVLVLAGLVASEGPGEIWLSSLAAAGLLVLASRQVATRLARHRVVTFQTVFGALSIYVIAGLFFAYLFRAIDAIADPGFDLPAGTDSGIGTFTYFSFVTLTTLGYGDISPVVDFAKATAILEAVVGQIYLITIIGFLVGTVGQATISRRLEE